MMTPRSRFQRNGHRRQLCASDICFSWRVGRRRLGTRLERARLAQAVGTTGATVTVPLGRRIGRLAAKVGAAATLDLVCRASLFVSHSRSCATVRRRACQRRRHGGNMDFDVEGSLSAVERSVSSPQRGGQPARAVTLSRIYPTTVEDLWDAVTNGSVSRAVRADQRPTRAWWPVSVGRQRRRCDSCVRTTHPSRA